MNETKYYTVTEVAVIFAVDPQTIRIWLRDGTLNGIKIGRGRFWRIPQSSIDDLARRKRDS